MSAQQPHPEDRPLTRREALAREQGRVRNRDLRATCGLTTQQAWKILRRLVLDGHLSKSGTGTRDAAYQLTVQHGD